MSKSIGLAPREASCSPKNLASYDDFFNEGLMGGGTPSLTFAEKHPSPTGQGAGTTSTGNPLPDNQWNGSFRKLLQDELFFSGVQTGVKRANDFLEACDAQEFKFFLR